MHWILSLVLLAILWGITPNGTVMAQNTWAPIFRDNDKGISAEVVADSIQYPATNRMRFVMRLRSWKRNIFKSPTSEMAFDTQKEEIEVDCAERKVKSLYGEYYNLGRLQETSGEQQWRSPKPESLVGVTASTMCYVKLKQWKTQYADTYLKTMTARFRDAKTKP